MTAGLSRPGSAGVRPARLPGGPAVISKRPFTGGWKKTGSGHLCSPPAGCVPGDMVAFAGAAHRQCDGPQRARDRIRPSTVGRTRWTRPLPGSGAMPLPPYIAKKRPPDAAGPRRLSDRLCPRGRLGGRAHRRAAFHAGTAGRAGSEGDRPRRSSPCMSGAGTFLPVKAEDTADHMMHAETGC